MSWYSDRIAALNGVAPPTPSPTTRQNFNPATPYVVPQPYNAPQPARNPMDTPVSSLSEALANGWAGSGAQLTQQSQTCPNCNGPNLFIIGTGGVMGPNGQQVRPMICDDCGYPRPQAFSKGGAGNLAKVVGSAQPARQLAPGHVITVKGEGGGDVTLQR